MMWTKRRMITSVIALGMVGLIAAQFVRFVIPPLKIHNPPIEHAVEWDSPETERLWKAACADCHSHETVFPFYSYVAPFGWLIAYDVNQGRDELNVSINDIDLEEMIETIEDGEMPPSIYLPLHPEADLTDAEKQALIDGLKATFN